MTAGSPITMQRLPARATAVVLFRLTGLTGLTGLISLSGFVLPVSALAQAINVVAPTLAPRQPATATSSPATSNAGAPSAGYGAATYGGTPGYGAAPTGGPPATYGQQPAYGPQPGTTPSALGSQPPYAPQPAFGQSSAPYGSGAASNPPGAAPPSTLASRNAAPYGASSAANPPVGGDNLLVAPVRSSATGSCRADPSPDRQSVSLLGPDALPRLHVPLGEFRVQQVFHSPDGRWAIAVTKLRGRAQFAALTFDLARCEPQNTVDLPTAADDARFEADEAIVSVGGAERRIRLANARVR